MARYNDETDLKIDDFRQLCRGLRDVAAQFESFVDRMKEAEIPALPTKNWKSASEALQALSKFSGKVSESLSQELLMPVVREVSGDYEQSSPKQKSRKSKPSQSE